MKLSDDRPYADPETAARKLLEIANATEALQEGRIHIEKINGPFLFTHGGSPVEYGAGLALAIQRGWLWLHEVRDLREIHAGRRGPVRLMDASKETPQPGASCAGAVPSHRMRPSERGPSLRAIMPGLQRNSSAQGT